MKDKLLSYLSVWYPLNNELRAWLRQTLKLRQLRRKELLLRAGEVSDCICFVANGLLRAYHVPDTGEDTTVWFMKEGDIAISVKSFYEQTASAEYIEALEPTVLLYISYAELQEAYARFPDFNVLGRLITERYYILSEERLLCIRNKRAIERYRFLLHHHPDIIERAPDKYIASYLDISKGTLCRLKHGVL
jgi:CRP/FNR family transcriptional regulator, anaerobic regulatory protein